MLSSLQYEQPMGDPQWLSRSLGPQAFRAQKFLFLLKKEVLHSGPMTSCSRQSNGPQDALIQTPGPVGVGACEAEGPFRCDCRRAPQGRCYLGLPRWAPWSHQGSYEGKEKAEDLETEQEM